MASICPNYRTLSSGKSVQLTYNRKARYLPVWEKRQIHKCIIIKILDAPGDLCTGNYASQACHWRECWRLL
jgi:hypothetical protein